MNAFNEISKYIDSIQIIDVHEHLINDKLRVERYKDYISLIFSNYTYINAISAGISEEKIAIMKSDKDLIEKYYVYVEVCENIKNTTAFRCIDNAFYEIYGMGILDEDYKELNKRFCLQNKLGITRQILNKMNVEYAVNDVFDKYAQNTDYVMGDQILKTSARCDKYIMIHENLSDIEMEFNKKINTLDEFCDVLEDFICLQKEKYNAVSLKIAVAYNRSLNFELVNKTTAAEVFKKMLILRENGKKVHFEEIKTLSDFITHFIIKEANKHNLVLQIHTGIQDSNINYLNNSTPLNLNNLFELYPEVIFNLFHTGYPFGREAGVLAKMFQNVYVDFSWVHILSSKYAVDLMEEYFELIPANKFCGFGGDFSNVEASFGHLQIAKYNISLAISNMVNKGWYSLEYGKQLAKQILYDNPKKIYNI